MRGLTTLEEKESRPALSHNPSSVCLRQPPASRAPSTTAGSDRAVSSSQSRRLLILDAT